MAKQWVKMIFLIEITELLFFIVLIHGQNHISKYHVQENITMCGNTSSQHTYSVIHCAITCLQSETCCSTRFNKEKGMCTITDFGGLQTRSGDTEASITIVTAKKKYLTPLIQDCTDLSVCFTPGVYSSGVYSIHPQHNVSFDVYCDMETDGGGWTVFQNRMDGTTSFSRGWTEYEDGFGNLTKEFWLGNSKINKITSSGAYILRIDLKDFDGNTRYAVYSSVIVGDVYSNYILNISGYSGDAGDSLMDVSTFGGKRQHNGMQFTTIDQDNDKKDGDNCAVRYTGGWWYNSCYQANLNGEYLITTPGSGVIWSHWKGYTYSLKSTKMMIRRY